MRKCLQEDPKHRTKNQGQWTLPIPPLRLLKPCKPTVHHFPSLYHLEHWFLIFFLFSMNFWVFMLTWAKLTWKLWKLHKSLNLSYWNLMEHWNNIQHQSSKFVNFTWKCQKWICKRKPGINDRKGLSYIR